MNALKFRIADMNPAESERLRRQLIADREQSRADEQKVRLALRDRLEPRAGGVLRRLSPAAPPNRPPIKTVAYSADAEGRRVRITTVVEFIGE